MIPEQFAVIGAIIASFGGLYYLYETVKGTAKPNRITWLLWGIFPMITFFAQRAQGVEGLSWATFVSGLTPFLVLTASFLNKKAYWQSKPLDYACMLIGFFGIVLWALTKSPNLAILFAILADLAAGAPTVIKSYKHPESESWIAYAISTFGFGLSMLTIQSWTFENYAFISYLTFMNGLLAVFAARKTGKNKLHIEP
jgi:hypothetical protein